MDQRIHPFFGNYIHQTTGLNMSDSQLQIREIESSDLQDLLSLYKHLHSDDSVLDEDTAENVWQQILADPHHHCFLGCIDGQIVASCVMMIMRVFKVA